MEMKPIMAIFALVVVSLLGACGSAAQTPSTGAPPGTPAGTQAGTPAGTQARPDATGPSVMMTLDGYQFQVALVRSSIRATPTFTTDNGTGLGGGTLIAAPPRFTLIVATLTVTNRVDRPEPFDFPGGWGILPAAGNFTDLAVPRAEAATFGILPSNLPLDTLCPLPGGYCPLSAKVSAHSDFGFQPQLAPGASGTITIVAGAQVYGDQLKVPEGVPVQDVRVFVATAYDLNGTPTWAQLS
jgi:hypothetical protein